MINLQYGTGPGSNSRPLDLQTDSHLLPDTLDAILTYEDRFSWVEAHNISIGPTSVTADFPEGVLPIM